MSKHLLKYGNGTIDVATIVNEADAELTRMIGLRSGGILEVTPSIDLNLEASCLRFDYSQSDN